jgi:hypothetical protein
MDLVKEEENNAPLLLTTFDAAWFASVGYVRLVDVKFKFLGQGTLSVEDIEKVLDAILKKAKVIGTKAKILKKIVTLATSVTATEFLLDLESGNTSIASVGCPGVIDVDGCVKGLNPGVTEVTGTLDLNEIQRRSAHVSPRPRQEVGLGRDARPARARHGRGEAAQDRHQPR